ncbi:hypothetical protein [Actinoplanes sp. TFC3]|uniref:hypothetical protein n=1 Tax=Actinoplanes sp. TFC3 TaxID=1710355 RepID=UPI000A4D325B|nr:hypothetical protein [Actinoplanes sp. TFC3]
MVPEVLSVPQFRTEPVGDDATPRLVAADHSDEAMARLRHPFDLQPAPASPGEAG